MSDRIRLDVALLIAAATLTTSIVIYVLAQPGAWTAILGG